MHGGAILSYNHKNVFINGCTFDNNTAPKSGDAVAYMEDTGGASPAPGLNTTGPSITNCIFLRSASSSNASVEGISANITYSMFLTADPTSAEDPSNVRAADFKMQWNSAGYYELLAGSPAIDAGTAEGASSLDIRGVSRPQGKAFDIGCYEYIFPQGGGTTKVETTQDVTAKIESGRGDVEVALGFENGPQAADIDGYQSVAAVASPELLEIAKISPTLLPP